MTGEVLSTPWTSRIDFLKIYCTAMSTALSVYPCLKMLLANGEPWVINWRLRIMPFGFGCVKDWVVMGARVNPCMYKASMTFGYLNMVFNTNPECTRKA